MDSNRETQNVPAIQKAIKALESFKNKRMIFARREDFENISQQYQPVVTIVEFQPQDFTRLGNDKSYYPSKGATNRIGDAAGVSFLEGVGGTREEGSATAIKFVKHETYFQVEGHYIVTGSAQGERLKPDGTPRRSSLCEYGFDVVQRTNEALVNDAMATNDDGSSAQKIKTEIKARAKFLELQKFAIQKARTGAELAVIRELVGMNTGFNKTDVERGCEMLFSQIIENNRFRLQVLAEIGQTPDGRAAIVQALFGATRSIYGPSGPQPVLPAGESARQIEEQPSALQPGNGDHPQEQAPSRTVDVPSGEVIQGNGELFEQEDEFPSGAQSEPTPEEKLKEILKDFIPRIPESASTKSDGNIQAALKAIIEKPDATVKALNSWIDRINLYFQNIAAKKGGAA
jgi:hypothetical protein